eukprot:3620058-Amphidinium_carterae.1
MLLTELKRQVLVSRPCTSLEGPDFLGPHSFENAQQLNSLDAWYQGHNQATTKCQRQVPYCTPKVDSWNHGFLGLGRRLCFSDLQRRPAEKSSSWTAPLSSTAPLARRVVLIDGADGDKSTGSNSGAE